MAKGDGTGKAGGRKGDAGRQAPPMPRILAARKLLDRASGARMCFGEPVQADGRTVIPVARLFVAGGLGFGDGTGPVDIADGSRAQTTNSGSGGGGGGTVTANPVGFIELSAAGARFEAIPDPERSARAISIAIKTIPAVLAAVAGVRAIRAGAAPREVLRVARPGRRGGPGSRALRRRAPTLLP